MRLAGIDVDAPPGLLLPLLGAALIVLAMVLARLARGLTGRWLSSKPAVSLPVACAVVIGGMLWIPDLALGLPGRLGRWLEGALDLGFVLACALVVSRVTVAAVTEYVTRNPSMRPAVGVARVSVRLLVGALAIITALESLGVPVAPLLTTLGVGSLAVALALQETLANFFAGLYLLADRPVRAGDYIKINDATGEEGYVESIGWRSSRLRTLKNNTVIVPNQKLSQAILTNFHLPASPVGMAVNVVVAPGAEPTAVEACLNDELVRATAELPKLIGGNPVARLLDLTDAGQVWTCGLQVADVEAQGLAGHEVRKRLLARLRREGIALGVPARLVRTADGGPTPTPPGTPDRNSAGVD
ncbi:MAG TPA: mechanosensitive ion channel domain-containing protein [Polyangia bacterium]|nr:mechanosensitive ion channel domain-containing protein [Polyangia bacterium]